MTIQTCHGLEILDSRGNPSILVTVTASDGSIGKAFVPSGASTGEHEACELRDNDPLRYFGKGVQKAIQNINTTLNGCLKGKSIFQQREIDESMILMDATINKKVLGANAILGVSLAVARCAANSKKMPLYRYLGGNNATILPCPMMNIINGGVHADSSLDFQEFMIRPIGASSFKEAVRFGSETFHSLKSLLKSKSYSTSVGDEGGFAPNLSSNEEAFDLILEAITKVGLKPGIDITLAIDCAASEFFDKGQYIERKNKEMNKPFKQRSSKEMTAYLQELAQKYPIDSIEDGLDQNDWEGWAYMTSKLGDKLQLVGDDIFVTNSKFLQRGIHDKVANSILIKVNQIGTLSETLDAIKLAQNNHYKTVISHRSGETEDTFIADLAVAVSSKQIKTGSLSRSERIAKYNRLLEIEEELGCSAIYAPTIKN